MAPGARALRCRVGAGAKPLARGSGRRHNDRPHPLSAHSTLDRRADYVTLDARLPLDLAPAHLKNLKEDRVANKAQCRLATHMHMEH